MRVGPHPHALALGVPIIGSSASTTPAPEPPAYRTTGLPDYRTVTTAVAVRPNTSGSYISSARAGAVRNVPDVVARTM